MALGLVLGGTAAAAPTALASGSSASGAVPPTFSYRCNGAICIIPTNDGYVHVSATQSFVGHIELSGPGGHLSTGNRGNAYTNIGEVCETAH